ncbi:HNH endonuclease signature motif containing protein [Microbacterium terricola]|uniref:HNH nuclease domain-containing protein n=1 Tax=Microbacterium terricola TaxID=344163 RepID=A0ABM8E097_9MICO|nr:HNH endonuclease signature motif containing protein [Microbacterium terricola]UYK41071.1 HNH endonuclease [Microbacterium terricola]BDV31170.1 hypothetical protein Microterr_18300 [Microbacterium terricola]
MGGHRPDAVDLDVWRRELDALTADAVHAHSAVAAAQAEETRVLARAVDLIAQREAQRHALGRRDFGTALAAREVAAELAAALRISDQTMQSRIGDAGNLVFRLPTTWAALATGQIDAAQAAVIRDTGSTIADDETRAVFEARMLEIAQTESAGRMREPARTLAATMDPATAADRARQAQGRRGVRLLDLDDGLARLQIDHDATLVHAIYDRVTQLAHAVRDAAGESDENASLPSAGRLEEGTAPAGTGDASIAAVVTAPAKDRESTDEPVDLRGLDEMRADVAADLLLAGAPTAHGDPAAMGAIRGHVQITVPALSLAGVERRPAVLAGYGPISIDVARRLAASAPGWDRVLTDPFTGLPIAVDRYRPSAELKRFLHARDERCRFPGCRRRARRTDIDHTIDAALGGETSECNLACFCRRHHTLKHATEWRVRQLGAGVLEWTGPTGRSYLDRPPSTVRFVPDADPPPF